MKRISVIIVNYRTAKLAVACIESLIDARTQFSDMQVILVDAASGDGSAELFGQEIAARCWRDWVELLPLSINGGFAFANNRAMMLLAQRGALPDYIALINPDARATPGALENLALLLERQQDAGAVGAQLIHADGRRQASAFRFPTLISEFCQGARTGIISRLFRQPAMTIVGSAACQVPWVTGAAVLLRTAALESVGLFDEGFFLYFEETELMWRLRRSGWQIWHEPLARVIHEGGAATKIRDPETGNPLKQRLPRYWYQSRRRYFSLIGGRLYAFLATLAWLCGHCLWTVRRLATHVSDDGPVSPATDLFTYGLLWPLRIPGAAAPAFTDPVPLTPAWMETGESH